MIKQEILEAKFTGYDVKITYDDYNMHEVLWEYLGKIKDICKSLKNHENTFAIEYRKKSEYEELQKELEND